MDSVKMARLWPKFFGKHAIEELLGKFSKCGGGLPTHNAGKKGFMFDQRFSCRAVSCDSGKVGDELVATIFLRHFLSIPS